MDHIFSIVLGVLLVCFSSIVGAATVDAPPVKKIHEGKHWVWYAADEDFQPRQRDIEAVYDYADQAFDYLSGAWGLKPPAEKYALLVRHEKGGGFAAGEINEVRAITGKNSPGIGVSFDAFSNTANGVKGYWGYVLTTHEMVNLFTGQIVSGGWPVDWWANHRSPFPLMTAVQIEFALKPEVAIHHVKQKNDDALVVMFLEIKDRFGWQMFREAFKAAIADGIQWDRIGQNPSALRTNYVAAYLQIGAPGDVFEMLAGKVPNFDAKIAKQIIEARNRWNAMPDGPEKSKLREAYLSGDYAGAR
jgi:hypothetical protein